MRYSLKKPRNREVAASWIKSSRSFSLTLSRSQCSLSWTILFMTINNSPLRTEAIPNGTLSVNTRTEVQLFRSRIVNIETKATSNHRNPIDTLDNTPLISHTMLKFPRLYESRWFFLLSFSKSMSKKFASSWFHSHNSPWPQVVAQDPNGETQIFTYAICTKNCATL